MEEICPLQFLERNLKMKVQILEENVGRKNVKILHFSSRKFSLKNSWSCLVSGSTWPFYDGWRGREGSGSWHLGQEEYSLQKMKISSLGCIAINSRQFDRLLNITGNECQNIALFVMVLSALVNMVSLVVKFDYSNKPSNNLNNRSNNLNQIKLLLMIPLTMVSSLVTIYANILGNILLRFFSKTILDMGTKKTTS